MIIKLFLFFSLFISGLNHKLLANVFLKENDLLTTKVKKTRVVALTSLTADLINEISKDSLVGIPG